MANWIALDLATLSQLGRETVKSHGVRTEFHPSPYDIPEAVRSHVSPSGDSILVEFKYIGDEPKESLDLQKRVRILAGRHSGRLYSLTLQLPTSAQPRWIETSLLEAINTLVATRPKGRELMNYSIIKHAIGSYADILFTPAPRSIKNAEGDEAS